MTWIEKSCQPIFFLKLDFLSAYDIVNYNFFFFTIASIEFSQEFNDMVCILFNDAKVCIKINRAFFISFHITKKVRQGYPLAPYLFLIVVEVLNTMII